MATQTPYEVLGVKPDGERGRDPQGLSQARQAVAPRSEPGQARRPRRGSSRSRPPTTSSPIRRSGGATTAARSTRAAPSAAALVLSPACRGRRGAEISARGRDGSGRSRRFVRRLRLGRARRGGVAAARGSRARGGDRHFTLTVDFVEAATGAKKRLSLAPSEWLDVTIPAGIDDGQVLRLRGKGGPGFGGGPAGRRADRGACGAPPVCSAATATTIRIELPVSLGRGGARRQGDGADRHRAGDDDDPQGLGYRHPAAPARQGRSEPARARATST